MLWENFVLYRILANKYPSSSSAEYKIALKKQFNLIETMQEDAFPGLKKPTFAVSFRAGFISCHFSLDKCSRFYVLLISFFYFHGMQLKYAVSIMIATYGIHQECTSDVQPIYPIELHFR